MFFNSMFLSCVALPTRITCNTLLMAHSVFHVLTVISEDVQVYVVTHRLPEARVDAFALQNYSLLLYCANRMANKFAFADGEHKKEILNNTAEDFFG